MALDRTHLWNCYHSGEFVDAVAFGDCMTELFYLAFALHQSSNAGGQVFHKHETCGDSRSMKRSIIIGAFMHFDLRTVFSLVVVVVS